MSELKYISDNISGIEMRIYKACLRAGRKSEDVNLICVSKTKPVSMLVEAYNYGKREFGENKVQEILQKAPEMPDDVIWHMIGHLQKNKVRKVVRYAELIHSVDSYELAELINAEAEKIDKIQRILLEVNIASEESKYGLNTLEVIELVKKISPLKNISLCGLMCVAPYTDIPETNRKFFRNMRELVLDINSQRIDNINMNVLSMGMSNDFEIAIEEGATHVRVGTYIFGERNYTNK